MPTQFQKLRKEALSICKKRGHNMQGRLTFGEPATVFEWWCRDCKGFLRVNLRPMPNDINISGTAVALNCPADEESER